MSDPKYLVSSGEIAQMPGLQKTHFLNDNARRLNKSLGDLAGLTGFGFHIIEVEPGRETTEHHSHQYEDEAVYILEGSATATIGSDEVAVHAGDFLGYRKGGLPHSLRNTGVCLLKCIVVGQRLAHDVGDYPRLGKRIYRNEGMAWNVVDHEDIFEPGGKAGSK